LLSGHERSGTNGAGIREKGKKKGGNLSKTDRLAQLESLTSNQDKG